MLSKIISKFCYLLALILSHLMCIIVTYLYTKHIYTLNSAPANVNFLYAIPFALLIVALLIIGTVFKFKAKKAQKEKIEETTE